MVTREDVIWCYQSILGREPESEAAITAQLTHTSLNSLKQVFLESFEYQHKKRVAESAQRDQSPLSRKQATAIRNKAKSAVSAAGATLPAKSLNSKWLVIANCQTIGLANSLTILCPDVEVETCDIWQFSKDSEHWKNELAHYDHMIVFADFQHSNLVDFSQYKNITWFPSFIFRAFHPDLCYVNCPDGIIKSPMDEYSSCLIFAAYQSGLSIAQTRQLFTDEVYRDLGFYDFWDFEKKQLIERFDELGLDIRSSLVQWVRSGCFMHSANHPKINAVYDVATLMAQKIRGQYTVSAVRPHDNLTAGPIYPVYPEIAEQLGLKDGSYLFKPMGSYRQITLDDFIAGSFQAYKQYAKHELTIYALYTDTYKNAVKYITERKYEQSI